MKGGSIINKDKLIFILALILILLLKKFVVTNKIVNGNSMNNNFKNNDVLLVQKIDKSIKRYDVIIINTKEKGLRNSVIKRVIALPNETIQIKDGVIYINNRKLNDDVSDEYIVNEGIAKDKIKLNSNQYFVLGDNRNNSEDSRSEWLGLVDKKQIFGKPILRIYPFNDFECF